MFIGISFPKEIIFISKQEPFDVSSEQFVVGCYLSRDMSSLQAPQTFALGAFWSPVWMM